MRAKKQTNTIFRLKSTIFTAVKNRSILHGRVCVMHRFWVCFTHCGGSNVYPHNLFLSKKKKEKKKGRNIQKLSFIIGSL